MGDESFKDSPSKFIPIDKSLVIGSLNAYYSISIFSSWKCFYESFEMYSKERTEI
jgi:hypothetical protein